MKRFLAFALTVSTICMACSCGTNGASSSEQSSALSSSAVDNSSAQTALNLKMYDINEISFTPTEEYSGMDFLSEEQQRVFWRADFIYTAFSLDLSEFFRASGIDSDESNRTDSGLYRTGYDYDSVINAFKTVVSADIVSELVEPKCQNDNGEFVCGNGAKGINPSFMFTLEFEKVEATDSSVSFKAVAGYGEPDGTEVTTTKEFNFQMDKVGENWIVTKFEMWK